ncbi:MAG: IS21 family transposase [Silvanigrellales bacterium]|nr:IS21 family transposase [Silvanigrellales bacterium]
MLAESQVSTMFQLWQKGWTISGMAAEFDHDRKTVRTWVKRWKSGLLTTSPVAAIEAEGKRLGRPPSVLATLEPQWLKERFEAHAGNADVVRQDVKAKTGKSVSLRTVQRNVKDFRQELRAEQLATVRFETPPGKQLQVDFGSKTVTVGVEKTKVHVCVLTLGWSRKIFVRAWQAEKQAHWFTTFEEAFLAFGGVPEELLVDNAKALVKKNDGKETVEINAEFLAFCEHWGTKPRACRPYRARTKGKDESMVKYVKRNALAGREFASWDALNAHLDTWTREVADARVHGTTRVPPTTRFAEERNALAPLRGQPR